MRYGDDELELILERWARWSVHQSNGSLGFPTHSVYHMVCWAYRQARTKQPTFHEDDPVALCMERWLLQLRQHQPLWYRVITLEYLQLGTQRSKSKQLKISYSHYCRSLKSAKQWLRLRTRLAYSS